MSVKDFTSFHAINKKVVSHGSDFHLFSAMSFFTPAYYFGGLISLYYSITKDYFGTPKYSSIFTPDEKISD
jgi:hypothetical protein